MSKVDDLRRLGKAQEALETVKRQIAQFDRDYVYIDIDEIPFYLEELSNDLARLVYDL